MIGWRHRRAFLTWAFPLTVLACVIGCWVGGEAILTAAGSWLDVSQPPGLTKYVLVLPGGADTRPYVAAALLKAGYASEVLVLQCKPNPDDLRSGRLPSHEIERLVLVARGVDPDRIRILETTTDSTFADAQSLKTFLSDQPGSTVAIVTTDFHTRRARFAFRHVLADRPTALSFVSAPTDRFSVTNWWRHKRGLTAYVGEYLKLAYYFFRYGNGIVWMVLLGMVVCCAIYVGRRLRWQRASA